VSAPSVPELFRDAMSHMASGVAVITARRADGEPCGLAATAVTSYSDAPPSVLVSIGHGSRCHAHLEVCEHFGVHILGADQEALARTFAAKGEHKFSSLDWRWDEDVPALGDPLAYLRCRRAENFTRYDHTVLVGDVVSGRVGQGEPLLYARRRMDWALSAGGGPL
jgi:flavin reductase (DIM6/NTAB) family NADH-FMN oxidoreductase RutF